MSTVASLYFARTGRWGLAGGLSGMLASATRVTSVVIWGVVGLEWLRAHGWTLRTCLRWAAWRNLARALRTDALSLIALSAAPLGLLSYMAFLSHYFADPLAFMSVQAAWDRAQLGAPAIVWRDVTRFVRGLASGEGFYWQVLLDMPALALGSGVGVATWRRLGASYGLFVLIGLLLPANSATQSLLRYLLVLFSVFMMLGRWSHRRWLHWSLVLSFTALLALCFGLFATWHFVS